MKIRTRLMLWLLPILVGCIALVTTLLAFRWHDAISDGFRKELRSAAISASILPSLEEDELSRIAKELGLEKLVFIPQKAPMPEEGLTQYAPVYDSDKTLIGTIAATGHKHVMEKKFRDSLVLILLSGGLGVGLLAITLYFIASRIALPVQKLNNAALAIAAGHYGESAPIGGPKEIAELANTLNTMSECLLENIDRLKENSLLRERMSGEYECAMLLQHMMLQKNIDECKSDAVAVQSFTLFSDSPRGLLLDFPTKPDPNLFTIHMAEAEDTGFEGMYELLTQYKNSREIAKQTILTFDRASCFLDAQGPHMPLFWSLDHKKFIEPTGSGVSLESGDFFFLCNDGLGNFLKGRAIQNLLAKVLKIFAQEGLETTFSMLRKELTFAAKRKELSDDLHLLCFQVLNP